MEIDRRRIRRLIEKGRSQERLLNRTIRGQPWLDPVAEAVQKAVGAFYDALGSPGRSIKNVMHGTTVLGHPMHPALSDVPIGAWTAGVLADWLFVATGRVPAVAADLALAVGVAGAIFAALTGLTDFHETEGHERRTAIVHGMTMTLVLVVESVSLWMRLVDAAGRAGAADGGDRDGVCGLGDRGGGGVRRRPHDVWARERGQPQRLSFRGAVGVREGGDAG